jgi:hypothetical protein
VIVLAHRQAVATFEPAAFQDLPTRLVRHSLAEAVHPYSAANFGLICSFRHANFLNNEMKPCGYITLSNRRRVGGGYPEYTKFDYTLIRIFGQTRKNWIILA